MEHCMHCHGVSGDGNGPTARYLNPLPRDYRNAVFKFTSTLPTERIRHEDFERIIRHGIPGTYMPSFMLLEDDELSALIEYVRWLSMRGELERQMDNEMGAPGYTQAALKQRVADGEDKSKIESELATFIQQDFPPAVEGAAGVLAGNWRNAEEPSSVVVPKIAQTAADAASLERGRQLYMSDRAKCATCHGPTGRGNGSETETLKQIPGTNDYYPEPGLFDAWGHKIEPRDLTRGIYRGGRRPVDIYRRVYSGIKGTPMPAFGGTVLKDEEIWDLVNYVLSIPYYGADSPEKVKVEEAARSAENVRINGQAVGSVTP
jgi:mono/diheme cytochrome c family protein